MTEINYKNTLNLPKTAFPMKANLANREPNTLKFWKEIDLYALLRKQGKNRPRFILNDGPPYANGAIHMGHALNKTLKDIIIKAKTLSGFYAPYVPGWDCHGLPIEVIVEKKIGRAGEKVTPKVFRQACRDYVNKQIDIQRDAFIRLGVVGDWDHPYITMDYHYEANIIRSLARIIENGHVRRGFKPVHWCVDCRSALAEAEVEYRDKHSLAIDVRFQVLDEEAIYARLTHSKGQGEGPISVIIWTTTPWTLPANQAVALHRTLTYSVVQVKTAQGPERFIVAEELLSKVLERYDISDFRVLAYGPGELLEGIKLQHPFYDREVPVVLGEHVTTETGTGAVHTAPAHGHDDYLIGKANNLPMDNPVGPNGCFLENTPLFANQSVFKANEAVVDVLKAKGTLLHLSGIDHSYPHCWRHKAPLIFLATPQWFISMEQANLRAKAYEEIQKVQWIPEWGLTRISGMMREDRPDWCISRQRTWNVPLSLFVHKETGKLHPDTLDLMEKVAKKVEKEGIEAWFELDPKELLGAEAENYEKINDTLDVWFDSGVVHSCVLDEHPELHSPADLYLEGSDQHRGWFQTSLLTSVAMKIESPYKAVLTHGFILDETGHKMSKSLGNDISPDKIINTLGADVLRLWVMATDFRNDVTLSDEMLKRIAEAYRRIRNTARYLLSNLNGFDPATDLVPSDKMLALDRWAVDTAKRLQTHIIKAFEEYQFHVIYQELHNFCIVEMGGFYLDIIKDRQYTSYATGLARRSTQTAMFHIIHAMVRWLAPTLSFTAEEIWANIPGEKSKSVFLNEWYTDLASLSDDETMNADFWNKVIAIRDAVYKELERQRGEGTIGSSLEAEVSLYCEPQCFDLLSKLQDELRFILITSSAEVVDSKKRTDKAINTDIEGLWIEARPSPHEKCERCWHRRADVNSVPEFPRICKRCVENMDKGEVRLYA